MSDDWELRRKQADAELMKRAGVLLAAVLLGLLLIALWHTHIAGEVQDTRRMQLTAATDVCRESTDVTGCLAVVLELEADR